MVLTPTVCLVVAMTAWATQSNTTNSSEKHKMSDHHQMMSHPGMMPPGHQHHQQMTSHHRKADKTAEATGTIVSFTPTNLVLSEMVKGKKVTRNFVLEPETKRKGTLTVGAEVSVNYRVENKESIATLVKVIEQSQKAKD